MNGDRNSAGWQVFTLRRGRRRLVMRRRGRLQPHIHSLPFAQEAGLGGVIAHGMLTMGFAGQLVTDWAGPGGMVREISARFLHPVRPGDAVVLTGTVQAVEAGPDGSAARVSFEGRTPAGIVIAGEAVVAFRHPALPAPSGVPALFQPGEDAMLPRQSGGDFGPAA
jgi:acyl dehydratase